jgi:hypothetical protein
MLPTIISCNQELQMRLANMVDGPKIMATHHYTLKNLVTWLVLLHIIITVEPLTHFDNVILFKISFTLLDFINSIVLRRVGKTAKATIGFVMSVCLSIRLCLSVCLSYLSAWNNSAPTGRIFIKFDTWIFLRKSVEKIQVWLKFDKNNGHFTWKPMYIYDTTLNSS